MSTSRLLAAVPLALALAACSGQQQADDPTAGTAPGELSPAAEPAPAPAAPAPMTTPPPASGTAATSTGSETTTLGDAGSDGIGDGSETDDERDQTMPPNPARDPDPVNDTPTEDLQDSAAPPPPVQR